MRFLIYQNDSAPGWVYDEVKRQADKFGHVLVKWTSGLVFGKDYDGILAIPASSYLLDNIGTDNTDEECKDTMDDDADYRKMTIGRGIYEGLAVNHPNTYVVAYNTDYGNSDDIHLFQGYTLDRSEYDSSNYIAWADLKITSDTIRRSKLSKSFAYLQKNPNYDTGFRVSTLGDSWWNSDRRRLLLLNN